MEHVFQNITETECPPYNFHLNTNWNQKNISQWFRLHEGVAPQKGAVVALAQRAPQLHLAGVSRHFVAYRLVI